MSTEHLRIHGLMRDAEVVLERMRAGDIEVRMRTAAGDDWTDLTRNEIVRHVRMVAICEEFLTRVGYEDTPTDPNAGLMVEDYYRDPDIHFLKAGEGGDFRGGPVPSDGYYIYPFCDPRCCPPWGPFKTEAEAHAWSVKNLPEMG
ncbi:MAG: hypothetical protein AB7I36_09155 [Rhodospirillaceae bacterium]